MISIMNIGNNYNSNNTIRFYYALRQKFNNQWDCFYVGLNSLFKLYIITNVTFYQIQTSKYRYYK